ncbi:redoxin domain-containing protein [Brevundimonas lutea]|uniref:redoxin domain-containing protein n=1 Tax=Brevundimonas lutea TaxID=2293980 RepID=UPI000F01A609|nr:redoxin domain-containing protein [Brevundimonas lutea]
MIRRLSLLAVSALALAACGEQAAAPDAAAPENTVETAAAATNMAPNFTLVDSEGVQRQLSDYRGQVVILEWTNEGCPYVQKYYESGAMQDLQRAAVEDGAVWLTIISSAQGQQGYVDGAEARQWADRNTAGANHLLLDPTGQVGRLYDAKTTPDMRVIDEQGRIVYAGAIDDRPSSEAESLEGATNYVTLALAAHEAGEAPETPYAQPYGCSIKYADELDA